MNQHPFTEKQRAFLKAIERLHTTNGKPPSIIELAHEFHMTKQGAAHHVAALVKKSAVRIVGKAPHQVVMLLDEAGSEVMPGTLPVIGRVAAGLPIAAVENRVGSLQVDRRMLSRGAGFALRVKGDSMIDAGIHDGDEVIIRPQERANEGQIVLALVGDDVTIKRFATTADGKYVLKPENPRYQPIIVNEEQCRIQGIVIGLFRAME